MKEIPIARPALGEAEARAASEAVLSGWVTQGPRVLAFEAAFSAAMGARHACAVSNCTAALQLALAAVGVRAGDVVITASHSFIATANAVRHCQAEAVFVDVESDTYNIGGTGLSAVLERDFEARDGELFYRDVARLAVGESPLVGRAGPIGRLGAILLVHQVGMPADLSALLPIARSRRIPVVEDAACAVGSEITLDGGHTWERIGRPHADIACFSFHPRKVLTTGDGGMLTTNDPALDARIRLLRHHGMSLSDLERHRMADIEFEEYVTTGFNFRLTDIQAAVGIEQLRRLPGLVAERRALAAAYRDAFASVACVQIPIEPPYARSNWQSYVVRLRPGVDQREAMRRLKAAGIQSRRGVMCAHLERPYSTAWPAGSLPNSEAARDECVILPMYPGMGLQEVSRVAGTLRNEFG